MVNKLGRMGQHATQCLYVRLNKVRLAMRSTVNEGAM